MECFYICFADTPFIFIWVAFVSRIPYLAFTNANYWVYQFSSDQFSSDQFSSDQFNSDQFSSDQFSSDQFSSDQFSSDQFSSERTGLEHGK